MTSVTSDSLSLEREDQRSSTRTSTFDRSNQRSSTRPKGLQFQEVIQPEVGSPAITLASVMAARYHGWKPSSQSAIAFAEARKAMEEAEASASPSSETSATHSHVVVVAPIHFNEIGVLRLERNSPP